MVSLSRLSRTDPITFDPNLVGDPSTGKSSWHLKHTLWLTKLLNIGRISKGIQVLC